MNKLGTYCEAGFFPYRASFCNNTQKGLGDKRLDRRLLELIGRVTEDQCVTINRLAFDLSERESYYRLMSNNEVTIPKLLSSMVSRTSLSGDSKHILLIQDTSKFLYNTMRERLKDTKGLGPLRNQNFFGYWLHPCLGIDAQSGFPTGIYDAQIWHRDPAMDTYENRKGEGLAFASKSSSRWVSGVRDSRSRIPDDVQVTLVADRESDCYESMCEIIDAKTHFLIRSQYNRNILEGPGKLKAYTEQLPVQGKIKVHIKQDKRANRPKSKEVELAVRYGKVTLKRSHKAQSSGILDYPPNLPLYVLDVQEENATGEPIHWRLLTTHPIKSLQDAITLISYYKQRWHIEQLFRTMKKQGLKTEELELETGQAIIRMGIVALEAALRIMQLNLSMDAKEEIPIEIVFSATQTQLLKLLCAKYEGNTDKQKNPYQQQQLTWAAWIIARIGGWKGYLSQARPGPITFKRGWEKFNQMMIPFLMINQNDT